MSPSFKQYARILIALVIFVTFFSSPYIGLFGQALMVLSLLLFFIAGFIYAIFNIFKKGHKKPASYVPLFMLPVIGVTVFSVLIMGTGEHLHFQLNKHQLEAIDQLSQEAAIYEMSNMRNYHKTLNSTLLSDDEKYTTKEDLAAAYATRIYVDDLDIEKVDVLRRKLDHSGINYMARYDGYLVLSMGGFLDNEYGYLRAPDHNIEVGYMIPPYGLTVTSLRPFKGGWYFYTTT